MGDGPHLANTSTSVMVLSGDTILEAHVSAAPKEGVEEGATPQEQEEQSFPEGGYGWVAVAANFSAHFWVIGITNSVGIFTDSWTANATFPTATNFHLSFAGTLATTGVDLYGPLTGTLADYFGYSVVAVAGALLVFLGQFVNTLAGPDQVWVLFMGAVLAGLGYSSCIAPAVAISSHWFSKRLDLAMGIGLSGIGAGGVVLTPVTQWLVDTYGWRTALQAISILAGSSLIVSGLAIRMRRRPGFHQRNTFRNPQSQPGAGALWDSSLLRNKTYWKLAAIAFFSPPAFICPFLYIPQQIQDYTETGGPAISGALCLVALNVSSWIGQLISAPVIGRVGSYNVLLMTALLLLLGYIPLYLVSRSPVMLAVTCCFLGLMSSPFPVCSTNIITDSFGSSNAATKIGMVSVWFSPGALITGPILGAIADRGSVFDNAGVRVRTDWTWVVACSGLSQAIVLGLTVWLWAEKRWARATKYG